MSQSLIFHQLSDLILLSSHVLLFSHFQHLFPQNVLRNDIVISIQFVNSIAVSASEDKLLEHSSCLTANSGKENDKQQNRIFCFMWNVRKQCSDSGVTAAKR